MKTITKYVFSTNNIPTLNSIDTKNNNKVSILHKYKVPTLNSIDTNNKPINTIM